MARGIAVLWVAVVLLFVVQAPAAAIPPVDMLAVVVGIGRMPARIPAARGGVVLVNQLSRSGCWEGSTWGWDRGGIWVSGGCRAEFRVLGWDRTRWDDRGGWRDDDWRYRNDWRGRNEWGHARRIVCESDRGRYRECRIPAARGVDIVRQLSRGHCEIGYSWGWNRGVVWVDRGCRAEFVVY